LCEVELEKATTATTTAQTTQTTSASSTASITPLSNTSSITPSALTSQSTTTTPGDDKENNGDSGIWLAIGLGVGLGCAAAGIVLGLCFFLRRCPLYYQTNPCCRFRAAGNYKGEPGTSSTTYIEVEALGSTDSLRQYSDAVTSPDYRSDEDYGREPVIHSPPDNNPVVYSQVNKNPPPRTRKSVTPAPEVAATPSQNPSGDETVLYAELQPDNRPRSRPTPPKRAPVLQYNDMTLYDPIGKA
jgi:hypothetical protein